jgi:HEPN domain-containing protein
MAKNSFHYQDWLLKAKNDLRSAKAIFRYYENPPTDTICYHCHQVAEKSLKSFLVYKKVSFPKIHDLIAILNLCLLKDKSLKMLRVPLEVLNKEAKYPTDMLLDYSKDEARQAIRYAEEIFKIIREKINK